MKSDLELFALYDSDTSYNTKAGNTFSWLQSTISNGTLPMLDIETSRATVNDIFDYLSLKKKYIALFELSKGQLTYNKTCFKILDHEFSTLNEVERALNNKVFL